MSEPVIQVENLTKKFDDFYAVNNISFEVGRGEVFGFLGANGAGKTTAMKMLCGLLTPTSGKAMVAGFNVFGQQNEIKKNIGYMSQRFSLYEDLTVIENITFYGGIYGLTNFEIKERANRLIEMHGLGEVKNHLLVSLPLGWKQKLAFSVALIHRPRIVFLDEPTGGVDPITRRQFWESIYEAAHSGITLFVTTHYMDEAEYSDRISMMVDGEIKGLGTPAQLKHLHRAKNMDEVFVNLARKKEFIE